MYVVESCVEDPLSNSYAGIHYDPKDPGNLRDFVNRQLFLCAAAHYVPRFAASLFEVTWAIINDRIARNGSLPRSDSADSGEFYSRLYGAIREWAKGFRIEADWVINEAHDATILGIRYTQTGIDPVTAFGSWRRSICAKDITRPFQLPTWDTNAESESGYIARADNAWRQARDEYVAATKNELERAGLREVPARRKRRLDPELRLEWTALYRCGGKPIEELADHYCEETEVIRISVSRILKDLGFEPGT
jgi:hypothetical protein